MNWLAIAIVLLIAGCSSPISPQPQAISGHNLIPSACSWITQTDGYLPDPICSPGDVLSVDPDEVCVTGYSATVRSVSEKKKNQVYSDYGVVSRTTGEYEMDHIIPLELGGSNDVKNLFPQPAEPRLGFHEKDRVENWLHDQVCNHGMPIKQAQEVIARNWTEAYELMNK